MRRNKDVISRCISIALLLVLVACVAALSVSIVKGDRIRAAEANKEVDESKIVIEPGWNYGEKGFNKVAENDRMILEADYTTAEIRVTDKLSGKEWYSNPPERASDMLVAVRGKINSQIHVSFRETKQYSQIDQDNYTHSIRKGGMSHEPIENGIKFTFAFPAANVYIPVQYFLTEDGFQAEIVTSEIKRVGDKAFMVEKINLLPFFGAGGLNDEGYLFVPDGSGAIINFNNNKQKAQDYYAQVYGENPTLTKSVDDYAVRERVTLPVFGAKVNDSAFLAVIVSGETNSFISASVSRKTSSYNTVYPTAQFQEVSLTEKASNYYAKTTRIFQASDDLMDGKNYAVRYFLLNGEDANYTGMSKQYQKFLEEKQSLTKSSLTEKRYLVLDLIGAVSIEKYVFGIKRPVVTPLTTYNDVCTIVKELKEAGVDNLIINYVGAFKGGMENKMYSSIKVEPALGTKKEFRAMLEYLEKENVKLFLETNPIDIHANGNGYDANEDTVKTFFNRNAFQYKYKLDDLKSIASTRWQLLDPLLVPNLVNDFVDSAASWNINNISLNRVGEIVYSDYPDDAEHTIRAETMDLLKQAMQQAKDKTDYLMVHTGNAYCAGYADIITDTADSGSSLYMIDYNIPFYQMVFHNKSVVTAPGINTTVDYTLAALKSLENGTSLKYNLIYANVANLVGTEYNTMVSYSYEYWKDIIVEQYHMLQNAMQQFDGEEITWHENLSTDVTLTQFETGMVVVNYSDKMFFYDGFKIEPRNYRVLPMGGTK